MQLTGLLSLLQDSDSYRDMLSRLKNGATEQTMKVIRAARPYTIAALAHDWPGAVIVVTSQIKRAYNIAEQLPVWLSDDHPIDRFAEPTPLFYDRLPWDIGVIRNRIETLAALVNDAGKPPTIVTSARALMQRTMPVNPFRSSLLRLTLRQRQPIEKLITALVHLGYEPSTQVIQPGTFSRRGGIVDIFPMASLFPVRMDFFDDEIDTIRAFNPSTQRSVENLSEVVIVPAREALLEQTPPLAKHLEKWFSTLRNAKDDMTSPLSDADALAQGQAFPYLEHYIPYLYPNPVSLLDYAPDDSLIIIEDGDELRETVNEIAENAVKNRDVNQKANLIAPDSPRPYLDWKDISIALQGRKILHLQNVSEEAPQNRLFVPGGRFGGQLRSVLTHVRGLRNQNERAVIVTEQASRLINLWQEQDSSRFIPVTNTLDDLPANGAVIFINGALQEGWSLRGTDSTLHLLTDAEIFGWSRPEPRRRKGAQKSGRTAESHYADWKSGDFVVHVDFGIGKFVGLQHRILENTEREYLVVEYAGTDMLFVPIHQADRLMRYVGPDDKTPTMNRLGKPIEWTRARAKAQQNAEEEARELLEIYAKRASATGHAFASDTPWQSELEASFPFVETEDQLHSLHDVKTDMESSMPMDRLICGDVGYGKTEVALRAAFKAVMDGKQVAILAPTTILAQQHYSTFSNRLQPFPVKVEMLSRYRTKGHQDQIVTKLANGEVDIIVGTHRLLSADITFRDLGLVIVDEEQRFGVKHKEHFKSLRAQVDVLTLTATPIPRTMYMSLTGVRDISMIQTPPEERLPVMTHVGTFDEKLVRQAVLPELERGGQIFVVHNRVRTIDRIKDQIESIVPEARVVTAHGQMTPRQLETVMAQFGRGEYDILLSTSIIENGIDMPTVNTLIVDRADWFGMSQLYQLRGRVGRSSQQAYAYFFHEGGKLTEEARVRLETMAEYSDLGVGFQIAMRDLELRGAGDILSMRQTGHVAAVGLHLYTQLLTRAVREFKGIGTNEPLPVVARDKIIIDLPLPAYLPMDWIPEMALRLQIYRRIGSMQNSADIQAMRDELQDRFGTLPAAVEGLLYQMEIKLLAQAINATALTKPREHILIKLPYLVAVDREALAQSLGDDVEVSRTAVELLATPDIWQWRLVNILKQLREGMPEGVGI